MVWFSTVLECTTMEKKAAASKAVGMIRMLIAADEVSPSPPLGPTLGQICMGRLAHVIYLLTCLFSIMFVNQFVNSTFM